MAQDGPAGPALNALSVDSNLLGAFWELASVEKNRREEASKLLVDALQKEHAASSSGDARALSAVAFSPVETYCLKRLAKGLSSGRKGARQGFALALTGVLSALTDISGEQALRFVREHEEEVTGSTKGNEAKDIYLGDLFAFAAIARALRDRIDGGGAAPEPAAVGHLVDELAKLAAKKGYLKEGSASVARDLLLLVDRPSVAKALAAAPAFTAWLCAAPESADANTIFLALTLWDILPQPMIAQCKVLPGKPSDKLAFFAKGHLETVHSALMTASATHPRLHSVWGAVLGMLPRSNPAQDGPAKGAAVTAAAASPSAASSTAAVALWEEVCEQSLFGSSHERKYLGFELFNRLVPRCTVAALPALFSNTFMRCLVNNLSKEDNLLFSTARHCLQKLLAYVQSPEGEELRAPVTAALQRFGGGRFDRLTQTDAVHKLTSDLSGESVKAYVASLKATFMTGVMSGPGAHAAPAQSEDGGGAAGRRAWAIDQLCGVCKSSSSPHAVQLSVLRFLATHAFFEVATKASKTKGAKVDELKEGPPEPALAPATREILSVRVLGLVTDLVSAEHASPEAAGAEAARKAKALVAKAKAAGGDGDEVVDAEAAVAGVVADAVSEARRKAHEAGESVKALMAFLDTLEKAPSATLVQPMSESGAQAREALKAVLAEVDQIAASNEADKKKVEGVRLLVSVLLIVQLSAPASVESVAEDLPKALRKALGASGLPVDDENEDEEEAEDGEQPHHIDVLVDALLSLLARPSALVRVGCERAFRGFADQLTPGGLQSLLRVIGKTGGKRRNITDEDDDDESDDEEEDDEDEDMAEAEEESESEEEEEKKGKGAKGKPAAPAAKAASDEEESDSDDGEGMDDDAMIRMDAALGAMVGATVAAKRDRKAAAEEQLHFRFRALALLEVFVKSCPDSPLLPKCILPLLRALSSASAGPYASVTLAEKINTLLGKALCKGPGALKWGEEDAPVAELRESYQTCMRLASRSSVAPVAKAGGACCQYLLRVVTSALGADEGAAAAEELVGAALADFLKSKKCRLSHNFFTSTFEKFPVAAARLSGAVGAWLQEPPAKNSGRADHTLLGSLKLLAAALRHKPGSPAAAEALSAPRVENVLRGLAAAIQRDVSKPKRRVEILKAAAASVEALARVSAGSGGQLPQAGVRAVQQALAAAAAAAAAGAAGAGEEPVAGAGKLKGQFTRIEGALNRAAAGGGGGGAGTGGKKDKKRKEAPAAAAGAGAASVAGAAGAAGKKKKVDKSAASGGKKKSKKQE